MILTSDEIAQLGIVRNRTPGGERATTYDATVGELISNGVQEQRDQFTLKPRGIVWIVSQEEFELPGDVTGLATLRTSWTHDGLLALNVGIVDPNYSGPLATAVINFSDFDVVITKRDAFLRILFHRHESTNANSNHKHRTSYIKSIVANSRLSKDSFLNIKAVSREVLHDFLGSSRILGQITVGLAFLTVVLVFVTALGAFVPEVPSIITEFTSGGSQVTMLRRDLENVKLKQAAQEEKIERLRAELSKR